MPRNSSVLMRVTSLSSHGATSDPSTAYIHLTAASIARRQLRTHAAGSMDRIFSADSAIGANAAKDGMER